MSAAPDVGAYFERIGYRGSADAGLETLRQLHALHTGAIPFENLAAFLGHPIGLDVPALEAKLLVHGRGGWCFEHNTYFARVLEELGFRLTRLAARVRWNVPPGVVTARSHMLMKVEIAGEPYIADVGFGGLTLTAPLRLEAGLAQQTPHEPHRLVHGGSGYILQAQVGGTWHDLYTFDLQEQQPADYEVSNWYLATHPGSPFVKGILAARAATDARHALRNTRYTMHPRGGASQRRFLSTVEEYRFVLATDFHVVVPGGEAVDRRLAALIEANPPE